MKVYWSTNRGSQWCALLLGMLLFAGCETLDGSSGKGTNPPAVAEQLGADRLRIGDKITIEFGDLPGGPAPIIQTIREDGTLSLPFNVTMPAGGKSRTQLAKDIEAVYVPQYYRRLTVLVRTEDRFYFVGGEVKNPSRQLYVSEITVLKAIQSAGDFTDFARKRQVELTRANGHHEIVDCIKALTDPKRDPPIYPGDRINVPRRLF